jgi:ATP-dependent Clp protease ATP-binding subunit ClpA
MSGAGQVAAERRRGVLPALLDRVDDVVPFSPLKEEHLREIVRLKASAR